MNDQLIERNHHAEEVFDTLSSTLDEARLTEFETDHKIEIQRTFWKLDYILKLMKASHEQAVALGGSVFPGPFVGLDNDYVGQSEVHAESFYNQANRLLNLLGAFMPGLIKKKKFYTVIFMRNAVVEHKNVDRKASSWSATTGPQLYVGSQPMVSKHRNIKDNGFFPNTCQFYEELVAALRRNQ